MKRCFCLPEIPLIFCSLYFCQDFTLVFVYWKSNSAVVDVSKTKLKSDSTLTSKLKNRFYCWILGLKLSLLSTLILNINCLLEISFVRKSAKISFEIIYRGKKCLKNLKHILFVLIFSVMLKITLQSPTSIFS